MGNFTSQHTEAAAGARRAGRRPPRFAGEVAGNEYCVKTADLWARRANASPLRGEARRHAGLVGRAAEAVDVVEPVGIVAGELVTHAAFEDVAGEARCEGAAKEGIATALQHMPRLPDARRDDELDLLTLERLAAHEDVAARAIGVEQDQAQRVAGVEVPNLV